MLEVERLKYTKWEYGENGINKSHWISVDYDLGPGEPRGIPCWAMTITL